VGERRQVRELVVGSRTPTSPGQMGRLVAHPRTPILVVVYVSPESSTQRLCSWGLPKLLTVAQKLPAHPVRM
jgi:hypothetical protein